MLATSIPSRDPGNESNCETRRFALPSSSATRVDPSLPLTLFSPLLRAEHCARLALLMQRRHRCAPASVICIATHASHATRTFGSLGHRRPSSPLSLAFPLPAFSLISGQGEGEEQVLHPSSPRDKPERNGKKSRVLLTGSISVHLSPNSLPSLAHPSL